jgi:hypothetical protein
MRIGSKGVDSQVENRSFLGLKPHAVQLSSSRQAASADLTPGPSPSSWRGESMG